MSQESILPYIILLSNSTVFNISFDTHNAFVSAVIFRIYCYHGSQIFQIFPGVSHSQTSFRTEHVNQMFSYPFFNLIITSDLLVCNYYYYYYFMLLLLLLLSKLLFPYSYYFTEVF